MAVESRREITLRCPEARCRHRHLAAIQCQTHLPAGLIWGRIKCPSCGAWRWYDLATGEWGGGKALTPTG